MLEIFGLIWLTRKLASIARAKGRTGAWGALGPVFWIGAELFGFVVGAIMGISQLGSYGIAIGCALVGAATSFGIVAILPEAGAQRPKAMSGPTMCPQCGQPARVSGAWILCSACHTRSPLPG
jgi:hypothetical protein